MLIMAHDCENPLMLRHTGSVGKTDPDFLEGKVGQGVLMLDFMLDGLVTSFS